MQHTHAVYGKLHVLLCMSGRSDQWPWQAPVWIIHIYPFQKYNHKNNTSRRVVRVFLYLCHHGLNSMAPLKFSLMTKYGFHKVKIRIILSAIHQKSADSAGICQGYILQLLGRFSVTRVRELSFLFIDIPVEKWLTLSRGHQILSNH